jgi:hypothetical protein
MTRASDTAKLLGAGATILDGTTITTADNTDTLTLKSTDADASTGPTLFMQRDSASPADGDSIGKISFVADNDAGEATRYARIDNGISDASNSTEDAFMFITTMVGGAELSRITLQPTETILNEESADLDFRVESNGDANCLFVDGGNDKVGIGTNAPQGFLSINKNSNGSALPHIHLIDNSDAREAFITNNAGDLILGTMNSSDDTIDSSVTVLTSSIVFRTAGSDAMSVTSGHMFLNTTTERNSGRFSIDFDGSSEGSQGLNDTGSHNGSVFIGFLTGGTFRGSITNNNNGAVSFATTSDYRLKENVDYSFDATTRLKKLKPARFNWIADSDNTTIDGFLAHEVSSIVPEAIVGTKDEMKTTKNVVLDVNENIIARGVTEDEWKAGKDTEWYDDNTSWKSTITQKHYQQIDQSKLVPLLVKTIQELEARITALES